VKAVNEEEMSAFGTIASVNPGDESTWRGRVFLTFDLDWAHDEVIHDAIDLVEAADVPATWFVTHECSALERLRENPKFELGVHPNFNTLLDGGSPRKGGVKRILEEILNIVPEARCIRSHSMTQSSGLLAAFAAAGLTHDANHFIPASVGLDLRPWKLWNGMTRVPYFWEDDIFCIYEESQQEPDVVDAVSRGDGIKVFDMHPIHTFLNTEQIDRYERTRRIHQAPRKLITQRFEGYGTRNRLLDLLSLMKRQSA
jgi:hypothetical protein